MHVFVAMPYGTKEEIDFNKVYSDLIKPALIHEGYEVFRADEEQSAGNIRTDMFQELLLGDLVIVDLSIDNPNVWYELGVRHALRARGVILIKSKRDYMPFDIYTDRTLTYHIKNGVPDPDYLVKDMDNLRAMCRSTVSSWHGLKISPVYNLLRYLKEPDWKSLKIEDAKAFWEKQDSWEGRIELARKGQRPGDILVLADEAPIQALRLEAYKTAGKALLKLGQFTLALEQIEKSLAISPEHIEAIQEKAILLGYLENYDAAKEWLDNVVKNYPQTAETWALIGDVERDVWVKSWREDNKSPEEMAKNAAYEDSLLREAIKPYIKAFTLNPSHYYSGNSAFSLLLLLKHLTGEEEDDQSPKLEILKGGVRWALESALAKEDPYTKDFSARLSFADFQLLTNETPEVEKAYKNAVIAVDKDWFALKTAIQRLLIFKDLSYRPTQVSAATQVLDRALQKLGMSEKQFQPRFVFLFSGHRIDGQGRREPRFPAKMEQIAAQAISSKLDELGARGDDLGLCGGACGGDLLFAESCLQRGLRLELRIPFKEPDFLNMSVNYAGDVWRDRFYNVKKHPNTRFYIQPEELNVCPEGMNPFSRNNSWQLYTALSWTSEKVHFISLWDKKEGEGQGGTKHMRDAVLKHFGQVHILDTNELFK